MTKFIALVVAGMFAAGTLFAENMASAPRKLETRRNRPARFHWRVLT